MTQHFPQYKDVPLSRAPLGEVICQVRFSPLYRIANELPSELQEAIYDSFPEAYPAEDGETPQFQFLSKDFGWSFWIGVDSFTLSTRRYTVWEEFKSRLAAVQEAIQRAYRISSYRRIGLRYVNIFNPENTGYKTIVELSEILRPELVQPVQPHALPGATEFMTNVHIEESGGILALRVGAQPTVPLVYLDLDFYSEGTLPTESLTERCTEYHDLIYNAFRWSMNPEKLKLFGPSEQGEGR